MANPFEASKANQDKRQENRTEPNLAVSSQAKVPSSDHVLNQIKGQSMEEAGRPERPSKVQRFNDYMRKLTRVQMEDLNAKREGRFVIPESIVAESEKVLDWRMDTQKKALQPAQLKQVKAVEHAVLSGDLYSLRAAVKAGKADQSVVDTISKDLDLIGMKFDWKNDKLTIDSEKNNIYPGLRLTVGSKSQNSTGAIGPADAGPPIQLQPGTRDNPVPAIHLDMNPEKQEHPLPNATATVLYQIAITANGRLSRQSSR